ncbi:MAG: ferredoxin reductase domain-containing protein, partial [Planctomycetota bacterium]
MNTLDPTRAEPVCGMETWLPLPTRITQVNQENFNTYTFEVQIIDEAIRRLYRWAPGQFNMLYVPGVGEAAISISGDNPREGTLSHTIRIVGSVTRAILKRGEGGVIGLRGPFGVGWPTHAVEGKDVVLVSGGIGLAPLRPMVEYLLENRDLCQRVVLLFGCRTPEDRIFVDELERWADDPRIDALVTVDNANADWTGPVGV